MRSGARVMRESRCFPALPLVATSVRVLIPSFARERAVVCLRELSLDQRPLLGKVIGCCHSPKSSARCRIHPKQYVVICARVRTLHQDPARAGPLLAQRARTTEAGSTNCPHCPYIIATRGKN